MHAYKFVNWYQSIKVIQWHGLAYWLDLGMSRIGIRAKRDVQEVALSRPVGGWGRHMLYS
jgi:hypothetical protein